MFSNVSPAVSHVALRAQPAWRPPGVRRHGYAPLAHVGETDEGDGRSATDDPRQHSISPPPALHADLYERGGALRADKRKRLLIKSFSDKGRRIITEARHPQPSQAEARKAPQRKWSIENPGTK